MRSRLLMRSVVDFGDVEQPTEGLELELESLIPTKGQGPTHKSTKGAPYRSSDNKFHPLKPDMIQACAEGYVGNVSEERRGWDGVFGRF
jgi:hypothetical protein